MRVSNYTHAINSFCIRLTTILNMERVIVKQTKEQMKETKTVEKEKIVAEKLNGRFAMMGFIALIGAYLTTGQIIPGFV